MKRLVLISCISLLAGGVLSAQEVPRFAFDLGAGFTQPVGNTGRHLDEGWNVKGGVGYNFSPYFGTMLQLDFNSFGINSATLNNIGVPGGDLHVFSATIDPIVHLSPKRHADVYISIIAIRNLRNHRAPLLPASIRSLDSFQSRCPRCRSWPPIQ